ncbi:MAG: hypothetical protein AAGG99_05210 [Pseudomonadota bacterium]
MRYETDKPLPPTILLLTEHLDMILAAGEDLTALSHDPAHNAATGLHSEASRAQGDDAVDADTHVSSLDGLALQARRYEQTTALRIMSARDRAELLAEEDTRFAAIVALFVSGTHAVADAIERDETHLTAVDAGALGCPVAYLRTRGVVAEDCAGPDPFRVLKIDETFLIGGVAPIGVVMDLAAGFLDQIEVHHEIFPTVSDVTGDTVPDLALAPERPVSARLLQATLGPLRFNP